MKKKYLTEKEKNTYCLNVVRAIGNILLVAGFVLVAIGVWAAIADAQEVQQNQRLTFEWNANQETDLAGYRLYNQSEPNAVIIEIPAGTETTQVDMTVTDNQEVCFYLTAFDQGGLESDPSNIVCHTFAFKPGSPTNLQLSVQIVININ